MHSKLFLTFGPVHILIESDSGMAGVFAVLSHWFAPSLPKDDQEPDIIFSLSSFLPEHSSDSEGAIKDHFSMRDGKAWEASISTLEKEKKIQWHYHCTPSPFMILRVVNRIPDFFSRIISREFGDARYFSASYFAYNIMLPALEVALLHRGATFMHASSVVGRDGRGVVISGWGGAGKTTASSYLYLTKPNEWKFLSDDLAIVDKNGSIWFNPFPINVFPYNTHHFRRLESFLSESMGFAERIHWKLFRHFFGMKGSMRRRAPFNTTYTKNQAKIFLVVHVERFSGSNFQIETLSIDDLAKTAKNILFFEIRNKSALFCIANSLKDGMRFKIPSLDEVGIQAEEIYKAAAQALTPYRILVPKYASTNAVGEFFDKFLEEKIGF